MVEGVVAHDVPLLNHTADQVGGGLDHVSHYKEGGRGLMVLQHVQDLGGVAVLISAVKGEVEDLLGRVPHIIGVVLGQGLGGGVAHRGLPSVWKDRPQLSVEAATAAGAAAGDGSVLPHSQPEQPLPVPGRAQLRTAARFGVCGP